MNCGECDADFACAREGVPCIRLAARPAPAVPAPSPSLTVRALRMADMALASWENGYAFDSHGPGREAQRLVTEALAQSVAPAVPAVQPLNREQQIAIREAHCNTASDEYFGARPAFNDFVFRRFYEAGFKDGWESGISTQGEPK